MQNLVKGTIQNFLRLLNACIIGSAEAGDTVAGVQTEFKLNLSAVKFGLHAG